MPHWLAGTGICSHCYLSLHVDALCMYDAQLCNFIPLDIIILQSKHIPKFKINSVQIRLCQRASEAQSFRKIFIIEDDARNYNVI